MTADIVFAILSLITLASCMFALYCARIAALETGTDEKE